MFPPLPLLQTTPWVPVGHQALDFELIAGHNVSLLPAADDQAQWLAVILFIPKPLKMVRCRAASLIRPKARESALRKRTMPRQVRAGSRPQAMRRRHLRVKISRSALTSRTPSLVLVSSAVSTRTPSQSLTLGRKSEQHGESSTRTAPRETPADQHLQRKSHQLMRHFETKLGKKCSCLTHALMLGIATKLPTMLQAG